MSRLTPKEREKYKWWKNRVSLSKALDKLANYEDLEEQGRLIELPCKVGTEVFFITSNEKIYSTTLGTIESVLRHGDAIGDGLYLTKAEAEEALKRI